MLIYFLILQTNSTQKFIVSVCKNRIVEKNIIAIYMYEHPCKVQTIQENGQKVSFNVLLFLSIEQTILFLLGQF